MVTNKRNIRDVSVINFKNKMNKRAQFFLLAAVIISVVVLSLGVTTNRAIVNREPDELYDFNYEVQRESGASLDYSIYTEIEGSEDELDRFVELLARKAKDKNPDVNFIIIYGSSVSGITIITRWEETDSESVIVYGGIYIYIYDEEIQIEPLNAEDLIGLDEISIEIGDQEFSFPITEYYQIVSIIQKEVEDEIYITTK